MKQLNNAVFVFTKTRRNEVPVSFAKYLYYILNNSAILLADSILPHNWRPRVLPDIRLVLIINNNISFHFRLFPRKTNDQFFKKSKNPILGLWGYFGLFLPKFEQLNFPGKKTPSVFKYSNYLPSWQKSEKANVPFLRKMLKWQMDGQKYGRKDRQQWFCRTLSRTRIQLLK